MASTLTYSLFNFADSSGIPVFAAFSALANASPLASDSSFAFFSAASFAFLAAPFALLSATA